MRARRWFATFVLLLISNTATPVHFNEEDAIGRGTPWKKGADVADACTVARAAVAAAAAAVARFVGGARAQATPPSLSIVCFVYAMYSRLLAFNRKNAMRKVRLCELLKAFAKALIPQARGDRNHAVVDLYLSTTATYPHTMTDDQIRAVITKVNHAASARNKYARENLEAKRRRVDGEEPLAALPRLTLDVNDIVYFADCGYSEEWKFGVVQALSQKKLPSIYSLFKTEKGSDYQYRNVGEWCLVWRPQCDAADVSVSTGVADESQKKRVPGGAQFSSRGATLERAGAACAITTLHGFG